MQYKALLTKYKLLWNYKLKLSQCKVKALLLSQGKSIINRVIKFSFTNETLLQYRTVRCLHTDPEVFCRAQFQGARANFVDGQVPDPQMVAVAPPNCTKYDGRVLHAQRKAVEPG
jgi:hypothetical protein